MPKSARLMKELRMLEMDPPHGVAAWPINDQINHLRAQISGPQGSPYEKGVFLLDVVVPDRYPFDPPKVRFTTPIYHPNIDTGGRICLDTLNMPPKGSWTPSLNLSSVLATVRLLMAAPNPDDGLMANITNHYKYNRSDFLATAKRWTQKHAMQTVGVSSGISGSGSNSSSSSNSSDGGGTEDSPHGSKAVGKNNKNNEHCHDGDGTAKNNQNSTNSDTGHSNDGNDGKEKDSDENNTESSALSSSSSTVLGKRKREGTDDEGRDGTTEGDDISETNTTKDSDGDSDSDDDDDDDEEHDDSGSEPDDE